MVTIMSEDNKNLGGRPEGFTQDKVNARASLKIMDQLHKNANKHALEAYDVLYGMLKDPDTKDTVRRGIAKEIITLFMDFAAGSNDILDKPTNRHQEKHHALGEKAKEMSGGSVVRFSTKAE